MTWDKEKLIGVWRQFTEKNDFKLNEDGKFVEALAEGVLNNQESHGQKLCPCRVRDGSRQRDIQLLCPCNFKAQKKWQDKKECWCGLFVSRER